MARGGYRPGAGRPKGAKAIPVDVVKAARASKMKPLDYMLAVMNDVSADETRRDRMAIAAAPYVHSRATEAFESGKKEQQNRAATTAHESTSWADVTVN